VAGRGEALWAVRGKIVTMDARATVIPDGVVYVRGASIAAIAPAGAGVPDGFEGVTPLATGGTVYPGLIELHNHLSYNCLRLWQVPRRFTNRDQWSSGQMQAVYRQLISGPMKVIGSTPGLVPALVRYVEAKCLVAGVTTSQGIALYSAPGIRTFYQGVVRNTDLPDDPGLPAAPGHIPDVAAKDAQHFGEQLAEDHRLLLHLAEGTDVSARAHFQALQLADGSWAISDHLVGIHSVALQASDIDVLQSHGASVVWSPLSNLLLYGATADVARMKGRGVPIGLGSDWSPSGSKNLLGELKAAYAVGRHAPGGQIFSAEDLVRMVTCDAARILDWQDRLGSLEVGKRADLIAIGSAPTHYYQALVNATERDIILVMIAGVACAGRPDLVSPFTDHPEPVTIGGQARLLNFGLAAANPDVEQVSLATATQTLTEALHDLPSLAAELADAPQALVAPVSGQPTLALDEIEHTGCSVRMTPERGFTAIPSPVLLAQPLEDVLVPLTLDGLAAIDDDAFFETLLAEQNLPDYLAPAIATAYGRS
jgi:imidazolonepropionase-like amidohydrolase